MKKQNHKTQWISRAIQLSTLLGVTLAMMSAQAFADGGKSGGGGLGAGDDDELVDLIEPHVDGLQGAVPFHPATSPQTHSAYNQVLLPLMRQLEQKLPGAAGQILARLQDTRWLMVDRPGRSYDACTFTDVEERPIAKQVDGTITVRNSWMNNPNRSDRSKAALILHELLIRASRKGTNDCSTDVRAAVRAIMNVATKSPEEIRDALKGIGIYAYTPSEGNAILQRLGRSVFQEGCTPPGAGRLGSVSVRMPPGTLNWLLSLTQEAHSIQEMSTVLPYLGRGTVGRIDWDPSLPRPLADIQHPLKAFLASDYYPGSDAGGDVLFYRSVEVCRAAIQSLRNALPGVHPEAQVMLQSTVMEGGADARVAQGVAPAEANPSHQEGTPAVTPAVEAIR